MGSTAPYLHDGRATTLTEAILEHAMKADPVSEAGPARDAFVALSDTQKKCVIAFLDNLVLFKLEEQEASPSAASSLFSLLSTSATPRQVVKVAPKGFKIRLPQE